MARSKTTTTTTTSTTAKTETRRVTSLEPKAGRQLSSLEEAVVRMHHGVSVKAQAVLATNAVTDALADQLLDMEVDAHIATGRAEELPDVPADERRAGQKPVGNVRTQKILSALKQKS
jgi:predicted TIM-barrel enzyme